MKMYLDVTLDHDVRNEVFCRSGVVGSIYAKKWYWRKYVVIGIIFYQILDELIEGLDMEIGDATIVFESTKDMRYFNPGANNGYFAIKKRMIKPNKEIVINYAYGLEENVRDKLCR